MQNIVAVELTPVDNYCRVVSGIGGLIEQNTPFFTVKTLVTKLLQIDMCKNMHEREQLLLHHICDREMRELLPLLNDLLVLKVYSSDFNNIHHVAIVVLAPIASTNRNHCRNVADGGKNQSSPQTVVQNSAPGKAGTWGKGSHRPPR